MSPVRTLIVEDDSLLRSTLAGALAEDDLHVVAAVATAHEAIRIAGREEVDVLVTDLDLGDGPNGIVLAHALRRTAPELGIVVLTSYTDPRLLGTKLGQLPDGAVYVTKHSVGDLADLRARIIAAATGGTARATTRPRDERSSLTDTQIVTMRMVAEGLTNAEIARRRVVTEKAVEVTISRILKTLDDADDPTLNPRVRITRAYYALAGANDARPTRRTS